MPDQRKLALITGATSGIGLALAKQFAGDKIDLVIVARKPDELAATAAQLREEFGVAVKTIVKDLSHLTASQEIYGQLKSENIEVEFLVNNAGFAEYGPFAEVALEKHLNLIQLNIASVTALFHLFLADMLQRGHGRILNVASTAAFQPGPFMAGYYASKAYVLSLSEAVAEELKNGPVTVTALCPGPTQTGFQKQTGMINTPLFKTGLMSADEVAQTAYRGLLAGKRVVIPGLKNKIGVFLVRLAPRRLMLKIMGWLQTKRA